MEAINFRLNAEGRYDLPPLLTPPLLYLASQGEGDTGGEVKTYPERKGGGINNSQHPEKPQIPLKILNN